MKMKLARIAVMLAAPLLLASCLFTPGKFVSTLDIRAVRSVTFTYAGDVVLIDPQDAFAKGMAEGMQWGSGTTTVDVDMDDEDVLANAVDDAAADTPPAPTPTPATPQPET